MVILPRWGSHLPILIKVMSITNGPVLELGGGLHSTPFLHWACFDGKRELVTYEINSDYYNMIRKYESDFHKMALIDDWNKTDIERQWDVALLDHSPGDRRKEDVKRLAKYVKYIIIHDTEKRADWHYRFSEIYPLFKYRYDYKAVKPHTSVLSNLIDLKDFKICR